MKYFGHQVNASQDMRLKRLRKACGSFGIDLYWRCLELVADKLHPQNTSCQLEYNFDELAVEVDSDPVAVKDALEKMAELEMCHKVPLNATSCHYHFPKLIKYSDKSFRNSFPGNSLDHLYNTVSATLCHQVPQSAPKVVKVVKEIKLKELTTSDEQPGDQKSPLQNPRPTAKQIFDQVAQELLDKKPKS